MMMHVTLRQFDVHLASCRKLESSIFNALPMLPVGHGKLRRKLGQLNQSIANSTPSSSRSVCAVTPTHECVAEPRQVFAANTCGRMGGLPVPQPHQEAL